MTKGKILTAAIHQYSLYGYQGATMEKIAAQVGIKPASIYFFFANKKTLFEEAFEKLLVDHLAEMKETFQNIQGQPIEDIFGSILHWTVQYHRKHNKEAKAFISLITSPTEKHLFLARFEKYDEWLIDFLIGLIKRDKPYMTNAIAAVIARKFFILLDAMFWEIQLYAEAPDTFEEQIQYVVEIWHTLLGGSIDEK